MAGLSIEPVSILAASFARFGTQLLSETGSEVLRRHVLTMIFIKR